MFYTYMHIKYDYESVRESVMCSLRATFLETCVLNLLEMEWKFCNKCRVIHQLDCLPEACQILFHGNLNDKCSVKNFLVLINISQKVMLK